MNTNMTKEQVSAAITSKLARYFDTTPDDALTGTSALHWECLRQGASILRVHDVREAAQVIALWNRFTAANTAKP